jgi:hypothetical protein
MFAASLASVETRSERGAESIGALERLTDGDGCHASGDHRSVGGNAVGHCRSGVASCGTPRRWICGINGFSSAIIRLPEPNVTAIVLANKE